MERLLFFYRHSKKCNNHASIYFTGKSQWPEGWLAPLHDVAGSSTDGTAGAASTVPPTSAAAYEAGDSAPDVSGAMEVDDDAWMDTPGPTGDQMLQDLEWSLKEFTQLVMEQASKPGEVVTWQRAVGAMTTKYRGMSTAARLSALHNFGSVPGGGRYGTRIGVQPTSAARRTSTTMRGRARVSAGRPVGEHGYAAASARRRAAPHSLAKCVEENRALGS